MRVENHDFFYFDPDFSGYGDFTDNEVFSPEQRKEFLEHYSDFCRKTYHIPEYSVKACPEAEAKELESLVGVPVSAPKISKRIDFTHMNATLSKKQYAFEGWSLHTARTSVKEGAVVFDGTPMQPSPDAEFKLGGGRARELELELYFDEAYKNEGMKSKFSCNNPHRLIALRDGVIELFIITVHPNGKLCLGVTRASRYHPKLVQIADIKWNEWQTLKMSFTDDKLTVSYGDSEPETLNLAVYNEVDRLCFASGGMHRGEWRVRPVRLATDKEVITEIFNQ